MDKIGKTGHHGTGCYRKHDAKLPMGPGKKTILELALHKLKIRQYGQSRSWNSLKSWTIWIFWILQYNLEHSNCHQYYVNNLMK